MNTNRFKLKACGVLVAVSISGCGLMPSLDEVAPDNTQKYRKAETMPPLDIPPDLSTSRINDQIAGNEPSSATYSEYEEASTNPLAARYNITPESKPALSGEGDDRHLVVPGDRDETWQRIEAFWADIDMNIHRKDQRIGLMDTQPDVDGYAYRVRMERGDVNRSARVYVNGTDETNRSNQKDEAMLRQLAEYLGGLYQQDKARAEASLPSSAAQQTEARVILLDEAEGQQALLVEQEFTTVWDRVGRVLDSRGFAVEDRDRSRGTYYVRYLDPFNEAEREEPGFFGRMAFWKDDDEVAPEEYYYIKLISDASDTRITVLDSEQVRTSSETAKRLLGLIQEQLTQ
ncbi:outer membrane protein assembly factor BamC [Methylophaga sp. UBA2689]|jgi:outer membrane protein assembly factor BamC|uniref:outer membrane protein assembly factor BamC n=1 Tax=Methylophaga sp. UBA2689 TaxID=1946878 RepID=UPI0025F42971|nr:outer membrane protein assembly factor BamC [Methylophaga sp. UBA2689]